MISDGPSVLRLASFINGSPFKPTDFGDEGLPVIRIRQLLDTDALAERALPPARPVTITAGDLIFSWSATLAVRHWHGGRSLLNQHLFRVDPEPGIERRWLGYVLRVGVERLKPLMHGSAMTHITRDMLRMLSVSVPQASVQRMIADCLDDEIARIDTLISKKHRMLDVLAERRQAVIITAMSGVLITADDDDTRPPHLTPTSDHQSKRPSERRPLRAYAEIHLGRQRAPIYDTGPNMTVYLRAANVQDGRLDLSDIKLMNFEPLEQARFSLSGGDVLISEGSGSLASIGATAVWNNEIDGTVCFQNTLLRLRPRGSTDPRFLAWWCRYAYTSGLFASVATGANIYHLSADRVRSLPMAHVPLTDQRIIADHLDTEIGRIDATADRERRVADLLVERRQALITAMVTGEMRAPTEWI